MTTAHNTRLGRFIIFTLFTLLMAVPPVSAQARADRQKFMSEIRNFKHDYLAKELDLSAEQKQEFFPVYDRMDDEIRKLNEETRDIERKTIENGDASEVELEAAAQAVFAQKAKEAQIETTYFEQFKNILNNRQLLLLKSVERRFTRELVKHQHRMRKNRRPETQQ